MRLSELKHGMFHYGGFLYLKLAQIFEIAAVGDSGWNYYGRPKVSHVDEECEVTPVDVPRPIPSRNITDLVPKWMLACGCCHSRKYQQFERLAIMHLQELGWLFPRYSQALRGGRTWHHVGGEFTTTDGDSFGPMVRILFGAVSPEGHVIDIWHG